MRIIAILMVLSLFFVIGCTDTITNFEECANAGYPVMESFPRQCRVGDITFTEDVEQELIGGQRDEHGCLGPAGYSYNEEINTCIREWELDDNQREAAKIAVEFLNPIKGSTITQVDYGECEGCFAVYMSLHLNVGDKRVKVDIIDWEAVSSFEIEDDVVYCTEEQKAAEICTLDYTPVCGDDGVTYGNSCSGCSSGEIDYYTIGECS